jgi:hypothetical protein
MVVSMSIGVRGSRMGFAAARKDFKRESLGCQHDLAGCEVRDRKLRLPYRDRVERGGKEATETIDLEHNDVRHAAIGLHLAGLLAGNEKKCPRIAPARFLGEHIQLGVSEGGVRG